MSEVSAQTTDRRADEILPAGTNVAGRYVIMKHLAAGGMGRVYVAEQAPLGRRVALKVMHRELCRDQDAVKRFFREAVAVSQLTHPNTITVFDYGEAKDNFFIAMEYLEGEPLSERIEREGPLSPADAVVIASQVGRSLAEAHRKNIVHRDLKPENVFLGSVEKDLVKVLDFGIAKILQDENEGTKLTRMGFVCGTPEYMSPEQARGEELDGRSDLYALGVLLYEVMTGNPPFNESTPLATVLKHQNDAPPALPPSVPAPLAEFILHRAMAKDPQARPATAEAFIDELEKAAMHSGIMMDSTGTMPAAEMRRAIKAAIASGEHAMPPNASITPTGVPVVGKRRAGLIVAVLVLLVLAAGAAWWFTQGAARKAPNVAAASDEPSPSEETTSPVQETTQTVQASPVTVQVTSSPEGAKVFEDGIELGRTPLTLTMDTGDARRVFEFRLEGYADVQENIRIPALGSTPITVSVDVIMGKLVVVPLNTTPEGALVYIDDAAAGKTPIEVAMVPGDAVKVRFELDGYEDALVDVQPGDGAAVALELTKQRQRRRRRARRRGGEEPVTGTGGYRPFGD